MTPAGGAQGIIGALNVRFYSISFVALSWLCESSFLFPYVCLSVCLSQGLSVIGKIKWRLEGHIFAI